TKTSPLVVVAANALEAQRLAEEIPFFDPKLRTHLLPDWETLPYDHFSPHQDLISERLATLHHIRSNDCDVVIVPLTTALYPLPPVSYLAAYTFFLNKGERLDLDALRAQLTLAGYSHVQQVLTPGEYCVRGGLIDLFPMGSVLPYRLDLFDDEIETIATFDVDTQRTLYPVPEIRLLPAREFPLDDRGQATFRQRFRERFEGDPSKSRIYKDVSKGIAPSGIEYYLPLFFDQTASLFDYLPHNATLCLHHEVDTAIAAFAKDAASRYNLLRGDPQRPLLEPRELFLDGEQFFIRAKEFARIDVIATSAPSPRPSPGGRGSLSFPLPPKEAPGVREDSKNITRCPTSPIPPIAVDRRAEVPTNAFQNFLEIHPGRVLLLADSLGRREIMSGYLREYGLAPAVCEDYASFLAGSEKFMLGVAPVLNGFILTAENIAVVT
ncbi:MAG: transcription-repair coupling factor, partial [Gallionellaceae bacterium CG_4_10_14_3_um_filter_60_1069]